MFFCLPSSTLSQLDLYDENQKFIVSGDKCYDPSKGENMTTEFTPRVNFSITYKAVGNLECIDFVEFDEAWPNTREGGPPKPDYGNYIFRKMANDIVNSVPADLTVITADGTGKANYEGALVYATDLEGKVTKIDLTKQFTIDTDSSSSGFKTIKEDIGQTTLFITEATSDNGRFIYTRPSASINNDSNLWLYFGTGNTQKLQEQSNQIQNRLYGIKDKDFPNFALVMRLMRFATALIFKQMTLLKLVSFGI